MPKASKEEVEQSVAYDFSKPRLVEPVPVMLDRERHLRMDLRAIRLIHERTGINYVADKVVPPEKMTPANVAVILWACLLHEDPDLTVEEVETMRGMELSNLAHLSTQLYRLHGLSMPDATPGRASNGSDPNPESPTG